jgi:hypothetical protein
LVDKKFFDNLSKTKRDIIKFALDKGAFVTGSSVYSALLGANSEPADIDICLDNISPAEFVRRLRSCKTFKKVNVLTCMTDVVKVIYGFD